MLKPNQKGDFATSSSDQYISCAQKVRRETYVLGLGSLLRCSQTQAQSLAKEESAGDDNNAHSINSSMVNVENPGRKMVVYFRGLSNS